MVRWVIGSILHGVDPLSYYSFQPVLHDWSRGMCYPVCYSEKCSPCGGRGFPLSLYEWYFTIIRRHITVNKVLSAPLNKTFLSFIIFLIGGEVCVCVYVCMYGMCMYVCVYVCVYVCMCVCMYSNDLPCAGFNVLN